MKIIKSIRALVGGRPLAAYLSLAFGLAWGLQALLVATGVRLDSAAAAPWLLVLSLCPSLAAALVVLVGDRPAATRDFVSRVTTWRVPKRLYATATGLAAVAAVLGPALFALTGGNVQPQLGFLAIAPIILAAAFAEEVGWRGFALPRMLGRRPLIATITLGVIWGIWHVPSQLVDPTPEHLAVATAFVGQTVGLSVVITWAVLRGSGSVLLAATVHGTWNALGTVFASPEIEARALLALAILAVASALVATGRLAPRTSPSLRAADAGADARPELAM
jgi:membrane protease YdiL (CAAX protease family)